MQKKLILFMSVACLLTSSALPAYTCKERVHAFVYGVADCVNPWRKQFSVNWKDKYKTGYVLREEIESLPLSVSTLKQNVVKFDKDKNNKPVFIGLAKSDEKSLEGQAAWRMLYVQDQKSDNKRTFLEEDNIETYFNISPNPQGLFRWMGRATMACLCAIVLYKIGKRVLQKS